MFKKTMLAAALMLMPLTIFPQQIAITDQSDDADKLEKASVELLRDTRAEMNADIMTDGELQVGAFGGTAVRDV